MKALLLLTILGFAVSVQAQSLKDMLYSGKLKTDSGTVLRKGEDLSSKIDTTTKKPVVAEQQKAVTAVKDSATGVANTTTAINTIAAGENIPATPVTTAPKDNNKIWKEFIDTLTGTLRTEVLTSKKIKGGTYSVFIECEIGTDGQVSVTTVSAAPENSFLEQQIKERITLSAPQMNPQLNANGQPRKAIKKQMLTLSK
jgi:hypothetical protein